MTQYRPLRITTDLLVLTGAAITAVFIDPIAGILIAFGAVRTSGPWIERVYRDPDAALAREIAEFSAARLRVPRHADAAEILDFVDRMEDRGYDRHVVWDAVAEIDP